MRLVPSHRPLCGAFLVLLGQELNAECASKGSLGKGFRRLRIMVGAVPVEFSAKGVDRGQCSAMDGAKRGLGRRGSMFSLRFLDGVVFSLSLLLGY